MAHTIVGNTIKSGGREVETLGSHAEAIGAARDRAGTGRSLAVAATAFAEVALDFDEAGDFVTVVDVEAAAVGDLAGETDPGQVAALMRRTPEEVEAAHAETVKAKEMDRAFRHRGTLYPPGSWIIRRADSSIDALTAEAFATAYRPATAPAKPRRRGKEDQPSE